MSQFFWLHAVLGWKRYTSTGLSFLKRLRLGKSRARGEKSARRCDVDLSVLRPRFPIYFKLFIYLSGPKNRHVW